MKDIFEIILLGLGVVAILPHIVYVGYENIRYNSNDGNGCLFGSNNSVMLQGGVLI